MNAPHGHWEWQFGGRLPGGSPLVAWSLLLALAVGGVCLILFLYRHTLRELSPAGRRVLTGLRGLVLLVVLLCLADPVHVIPDARPPAHPRTLAVLVDRSASMDAVDNRAETRLANALRVWKRHAGDLQAPFEAVEFYRFGARLAKTPSLEAAAGPGQPADGETHLYAALRQVLDTSPAEIVCLTDGLDTTGEEAAATIAQAQQKGVPVDFVAGRNRLKPGESLSIREIRTPARVLRNTVFSAGSLLEINAARAAEVPVELWSGPTRLAAATLKVRPGTNVLPWSTPVRAGEPGTIPLEFRLGEGDRQQIAAGTTQIVGQTTVNVLYYQGALQWGYRFLLSALRSDPSFTLTSLLQSRAAPPDGLPARRRGARVDRSARGRGAAEAFPGRDSRARVRQPVVATATGRAGPLRPGWRGGLLCHARHGRHRGVRRDAGGADAAGGVRGGAAGGGRRVGGADVPGAHAGGRRLAADGWDRLRGRCRAADGVPGVVEVRASARRRDGRENLSNRAAPCRSSTSLPTCAGSSRARKSSPCVPRSGERVDRRLRACCWRGSGSARGPPPS